MRRVRKELKKVREQGVTKYSVSRAMYNLIQRPHEALHNPRKAMDYEREFEIEIIKEHNLFFDEFALLRAQRIRLSGSLVKKAHKIKGSTSLKNDSNRVALIDRVLTIEIIQYLRRYCATIGKSTQELEVNDIRKFGLTADSPLGDFERVFCSQTSLQFSEGESKLQSQQLLFHCIQRTDSPTDDIEMLLEAGVQPADLQEHTQKGSFVRKLQRKGQDTSMWMS